MFWGQGPRHTEGYARLAPYGKRKSGGVRKQICDGKIRNVGVVEENFTNSGALYTKEEKRNTPPYSIAREKFTAMQKRNLLLREKPTKASQTLNEEVSQ